jgi:polygalacturonase
MKLFSAFVSLLFAALVLSIPCAYGKGPKSYHVEKYGAVADGKTLNTVAIQKAIDAASAQKGGVVVFSKGTYLTGFLVMKSNVTLMLNEGSVLLGSTNPAHYEKLVVTDAPVSPKADDNSKLALLLAHRIKNFAIVGKGTIDGQGRELALTIDSLHLTGERIDPNYNQWSNRPSETARPKIINFSECDNVLVGCRLTNCATMW